MKAVTQVREAVKLCYEAQADYYRIVDKMPVKTPKPRVRYEPFKGFYINDILYHGTAKEVISEFDACQRQWSEAIKSWQATHAIPEPPRLPGLEAEGIVK